MSNSGAGRQYDRYGQFGSDRVTLSAVFRAAGQNPDNASAVQVTSS